MLGSLEFLEQGTNLTKQTSSLIHDRFAITDNLLWHFGSDVGGRDAALNAVSFGCERYKRRVFLFGIMEQIRL